MATPVPAEQKWLRGRREIKGEWTPSILNFYAKKPDSNFMSMIPPEFQDAFKAAIQSPGSFYSYRGFNTLVISLSQGRAYFLHRS